MLRPFLIANLMRGGHGCSKSMVKSPAKRSRRSWTRTCLIRSYSSIGSIAPIWPTPTSLGLFIRPIASRRRRLRWKRLPRAGTSARCIAPARPTVRPGPSCACHYKIAAATLIKLNLRLLLTRRAPFAFSQSDPRLSRRLACAPRRLCAWLWRSRLYLFAQPTESAVARYTRLGQSADSYAKRSGCPESNSWQNMLKGERSFVSLPAPK